MTHPLRVFQELLGEVSDRSSRPDESRGLLTADEREAAGVPEGQADVSSPSSFENEERPRRDERAELSGPGVSTGTRSRPRVWPGGSPLPTRCAMQTLRFCILDACSVSGFLWNE